MKLTNSKIEKETKSLNFHEWPVERQKKLLDEVVKDFQKEKLKTLKKAKAVSLRDK